MKRDIVIFVLGLLAATLLGAILALLTSRPFLDVLVQTYLVYVVLFCSYLQWRTPIVTGEELQRKLDTEAKAQARKLNRN